MRVVLERSYKKLNKKGVLITMFVYSVLGTEEQLAEYKRASGEYYRETDEGVPIWFSTNFIGKTGKLLITSKDKIVADTSELDQAASMSAQYGGNLGQALASAYASRITGNVQSAPVVTSPVPQKDDESLD